MTLLIGESPYYRSDCTRLPVALIIEILEAEKGAMRQSCVGLDIVEFPLNVNGKKFWGSCQPLAVNNQLQLPIPG